MKIVLASDHGGVQLRGEIVTYLKSAGHIVTDLGPDDATSVDYPDYASKVVAVLRSDGADRGILVCGTGQGMAMSANKYAGIRAAVVSDTFSAKMAIEHNNAKILCLGQRITGPSLAVECVKAWLGSEFEGGRHERRVGKIESLAE